MKVRRKGSKTKKRQYGQRAERKITKGERKSEKTGRGEERKRENHDVRSHHQRSFRYGHRKGKTRVSPWVSRGITLPIQ